MREFFESIMPNVIPKLPALWNATLETLAMTGISALYILVIGMALGILLTVTKDGVEHVLKVLRLNNKFTYTKDDETNVITIN